MKLTPPEIHLWFAFPDEIKDAGLLSNYEQLMNPEEKKRHRRFHFEKDRHSFLVTRALVRTTLSKYIDIEPQQWRFSKNEYGRPEIAASQAVLPIRFNISHTRGLVACAVTLTHDIGVDVETTGRKTAGTNIARRYFSPTEVEDLLSLDENKQRETFFHYWTLKESYIKARGMGLSLPLEHFTFHILNKPGIKISFDPKIDDDPAQWRFWLLRPTVHHRAAVSVRLNEKNEECRLWVRKVVPLVKEENFSPGGLRQGSVNSLRG